MRKFAKQFVINNRIVGEGNPIYIIAEAGVAHFGSEEKAFRLVDLAAEAGADAVKFQVYDVDAMISCVSADWKKRLGDRQLPYEAFRRIQGYCNERNITFFATAHDEPSLDFLESLDVPVYKVGSGEVGNWPYLSRVASIGKPIIFSTGMYRFEQIGEALEVISSCNNKDVAVLHCITRYPTPPNEASLGNIALIRDAFNVISGYSDHTEGYHIPLAAVALGASIIEKHISLDFNVPNAQDWKVSCGPHDLSVFINQVRQIESALKTHKDGPTDTEKENLIWAGKSLVSKHNLAPGLVITDDDLVAKRPGIGISPSKIHLVVGRKTKKTIYGDEVIKWEDLD